MNSNLERIINEQRVKLGIPNGKNKVEVINFAYDVRGNKLIIQKILGLSINEADIYNLEAENIYNGPLTIIFKNDLIWDDNKYKDATFNEKDLVLTVDRVRNQIIDYTQVSMFALDFSPTSVESVVASIVNVFIDKQKSGMGYLKR